MFLGEKKGFISNMNNFYKNIDVILKDKKIYKVLMIYLIIGIFLYIKEFYSFSYINFIYIGLGHPYILCFFLFPTIFIISLYCLYLVGDNKYIMCRFNSKKEYYYFEIKLIFFEINKIFLVYLITLLFCANIFASRNSFILPDPNYADINNLVGMFVMLLKMYILMVFFSIFIIVLKNIFNTKIFLILSFIIVFSFMNFIPLGKFELLFPSYYIGFKHIFSTFVLNIIYSLLYFISALFIFYFIMRFILLKRDIK